MSLASACSLVWAKREVRGAVSTSDGVATQINRRRARSPESHFRNICGPRLGAVGRLPYSNARIRLCVFTEKSAVCVSLHPFF